MFSDAPRTWNYPCIKRLFQLDDSKSFHGKWLFHLTSIEKNERFEFQANIQFPLFFSTIFQVKSLSSKFMKTVEPSSNPPQTALKYQGGHETTMIEILRKRW